MIAVIPTTSLWRDGPRSGIGRISRRFDYTVLAVVLVCGAFANAAGMVGPIVDWQKNVSQHLGLSSTFFATTLFYAVCLFAMPAICFFGAATLVRQIASSSRSVREIFCRFAWSLVPLGFAMWMAHYSFHFFTSFDAIVPVTQQFSTRYAAISLGPPNWVCSCCRPAPDWLLKAELLMLDVGMLFSLYAAWRISFALVSAQGDSPRVSHWRTLKVATPWAVLIVGLFVVGVWILLQPMQMRGMLPGG